MSQGSQSPEPRVDAPPRRGGHQPGQGLLAQGLVRPARWEEALEECSGQASQAMEWLVRHGELSPEQHLVELAAWSGLGLLSESGLGEETQRLEAAPYRFLKRHRLVPIRAEDEVLHVALADPMAFDGLNALEQLAGLKVKPWLATEEEVLRRIELSYGLGAQGTGEIDQGMEVDWDEEFGSSEELVSEAPAIRLFNYLLDRAVEIGASDIHVEAQEKQVVVRFRVDGILHTQEVLSKRIQASLTSRIKIMAQLDIAERRKAQDGKIGLTVRGRPLDLRVSTLPTVHGESVVLRLLFRETINFELASLGISPEVVAKVSELIRLPYGMILLTGPTGSGKTTTLYAALQAINTPERKIITIEDPVEYRLPGINQIQVNNTAGVTFAAGLRSILRQDPDVILVGEIRDRETADIAIHAALTGHLVFSTLHTKNAAGASTRMQDMGIDNYLISSALTAVMGQRLVRTLCPDCRRELHFQGEPPGGGPEVEADIFTSQGCPACGELGYRGRTAITELLLVDTSIRRLINSAADSESMHHQAVEQGMTSLRGDGWRKVLAGETTLEEVLRVTS